MLRDTLLFTTFFAVATAAAAAPAAPFRPIDLSAALHGPTLPATADEPTLGKSADDQEKSPLQLPGVSWADAPTEFGGLIRKHSHHANLTLQGVTMFGGSVGGSLDGRSAHLTLSWPTAP
jgi:hypothetical protein